MSVVVETRVPGGKPPGGGGAGLLPVGCVGIALQCVVHSHPGGARVGARPPPSAPGLHLHCGGGTGLRLLHPVFLLRPAGQGTQRDGLHFCLVGMLGSRVAVLAFA